MRDFFFKGIRQVTNLFMQLLMIPWIKSQQNHTAKNALLHHHNALFNQGARNGCNVLVQNSSKSQRNYLNH